MVVRVFVAGGTGVLDVPGVLKATAGRGLSPAGAEREPGRRPRHPSWRQDFRQGPA